MKNFKKIIIVFGIIFWGMISDVKAEVITKNIEINDAFINVKHNDTIETRKLGLLQNSKGEFVYSLNPLYLTTNDDLEVLEGDYNYNNYINEETYQNLKEIIYLGFGYNNRTSWNWYIATQLLVWEYLLESDIEIEIVAPQKSLYQEYMNNIKADIKSLKEIVYPSVAQGAGENTIYKTNVNNELILVDENNVLENFNLEYNHNQISAIVEGNNLILNPRYSFVNTITYRPKTIPEIGISTKIYVKDNQLMLMKRGELKFNKYCTQIVGVDNSLNLNIRDIESNEMILGGEYYLQIKDNSIGRALIIENKDDLSFKVRPNNYYLTETKTPYGYKPYLDEIYLQVFDKDIDVDIWYEPIKKSVDIEALEKMKLELYKDDTLIESFNLAEDESKNFELRYGNYTLRKIENSRNNSTIVDFIVDENFDESKAIIVGEENSNIEDLPIPETPILENKNVINIQVVDATSKDLVLEEAHFKIKNYDTKEYLSSEEVFKTVNGMIVLEDLPLGIYEIEQIEAPLGYRLIKKPTIFKVEKENVTLNIVIYQVKENGSILIKKVDGRSYEGIPNVLFAIFNENKELLEEIRTNSDGLIELDNIEVGKYFVKEVIDGNLEFDTNVKEVNVKDNIKSVITFSDRITVSVPKTDSYSYVNALSGFCLAIGFMVRKKYESA